MSEGLTAGVRGRKRAGPYVDPVDRPFVPSERARVTESRRRPPECKGPLRWREFAAGVTITRAEYHRRMAS